MTEDNLCIALKQVGKTVDTPNGKLDILDNISLDVKYQEAIVIKGAARALSVLEIHPEIDNHTVVVSSYCFFSDHWSRR